MRWINKVVWSIGIALLAGMPQVWAAASGTDSEELPAYYDMRLRVPTDRNSPADPTRALINPLRKQAAFGTCWAFGAIAAVESDIYKQLQAAGIPYNVDRNDVKLSEWYLAWVICSAPTEVEEDTVHHFELPMKMDDYRLPMSEKVYQFGGYALSCMEFMSANNASLCAEEPGEDEQLMQRVIAPRHYVPQAVCLEQIYTNFNPSHLADTDGRLLKQMILRNGAAAVSLCTKRTIGHNDDMEKEFFNATRQPTDHIVTIIGWDDAYDFSSSNLRIKPKHKGAWIIRNSWSREWADNGYGYIPYEDQSLDEGVVFEANLDAGDYSEAVSHEDNMGGYEQYLTLENLPPSWFAAGETAVKPAFLKRIGFYAYSAGMEYTIEIRTGSKLPDKGKLVYEQSGAFGKDGTPEWSGYRTVALDKYVFLPAGEEYTVSVHLNNPHGQVTLLAAPQKEAPKDSIIFSYMKLGDAAAWYRDFSPSTAVPEEAQMGSVIQRAYLKNTDEAMGQNFTVVALDDSIAAGQEVINLGKADELYGKNRLRPEQRTLSVMTVDIDDNETYQGTIEGEGGMIKQGSGRLTITGRETYTGLTRVEKGCLYLASRSNGGAACLAGPVEIGAQGIFGGTGSLQGDITGTGTLLLTSDGVLRTAGRIDAGLHLAVDKAEALQPGQVLLQADGGLPDEFNGQAAGGCHLVLSDDHTTLFVADVPRKA